MKKRILSLLLVLAMVCTMLPIVPLTVDAATELSATPNPKVEYGYTYETPVGTIRYIAQNRESEYFNWNYWPTNSFGGYTGGPEIECGTACISMALSYVGVNRTPKALLEATNGYTGSMWGRQGDATSTAITISQSAISSAMDNYINGNGKCSPLCMYIVPFSATSDMHWVLLVGKLGNNKYLALNPWHISGTDGTFTIQINGTTASYNGTTNPITSVNQWYNPNISICNHNYNNLGICTSTCKSEYNWQATYDTSCAGLYKITLSGGVYLRTDKPYSASTAKSKLIKEGTTVQVLGSVKNAFNHVWYKISYDGVIGYTSENNMSLVSHTCNKGTYMYYEAVHPHRDCYKCSTCGKIWAEEGSTNKLSSCRDCQRPGKPVLTNLSGKTFQDNEEITFSWAATSNTTHYNLYIEYKNSSGQWEWYDHLFYVNSGMKKRFATAEYRCLVQSVNSNCWTEDNSTWLYTQGDYIYFTVTPADHIPTAVCEEATGKENGVHVQGWAFDSDTPSQSLVIHVYIDGKFAGAGGASGSRPDVNKVYGCGDNHGFAFSVPYEVDSTGNHSVEVYALNTTAGKLHRLMGPFTVTITPHTHSYTSEVTTAATCTTDGVRTYTCSGCSASYTESISATGHSYGNWVTIKEANCTSVGVKERTCSKCRNVQRQTQTISSGGHLYNIKEVEPTCVEDGYDGYICVRCGYIEIVSVRPATGQHTWALSTVKKQPTCAEEGIRAYGCSDCDARKTEPIAATGDHKWGDWETFSEATCQQEGKQSRTCSTCGQAQEQIIPVIGHDYVHGVCAACGDTSALNGWRYEGSTWYYYVNGVKQTGWLDLGAKYYLSVSGAMVTGWQYLDNSWYYFNTSGAMITGWLQEGSTWYYMDETGAMVTGVYTIGGVKHEFNSSGVWLGEVKEVQKNGWELDGGIWYYYKNNVKATGWLQLGSTWYYMDEAGAMVTGVYTISGVKHEFNSSGVWLGEVKEQSQQNGWVLDGGKWYYYKNGAKATGWLLDGGTWYYMDANGAMVTGWLQVGGTWYYFKSSGAMVTGWLQVGGTWYYFNNSGAMVTGWLQTGGIWYYFYDSGAMATNINISGGWIDASGVWHG